MPRILIVGSSATDVRITIDPEIRKVEMNGQRKTNFSEWIQKRKGSASALYHTIYTKAQLRLVEC